MIFALAHVQHSNGYARRNEWVVSSGRISGSFLLCRKAMVLECGASANTL